MLAVLVLAGASAGASAQAPAGGQRAAEKKAGPSPAPVAAPKPPPELDQLKFFEGNWRCDGKVPAGPMGPEHGYKSTFKVRKDLDGFWYVADYEQKKSKDNPLPIRARVYLGYDGGTKKYVLGGYDNFGGLVNEASPGWESDRMIAAGDGTAMGQKVGFRDTFTKKGERELIWLGEMKMGKDWVVIGNDVCKR